jgi:threonine dehydrogenase-like Zn-dependent dehydrogenase
MAEECLIHAFFSMISPGAERLVAAGEVPTSHYDEMRCPYMGGDFCYPLKYGRSLVGEVERGPEDLCGHVVHVFHPHQDYAVVNCADVQPLPPAVPPWRATLLSNLELTITAVWDSGLRIGDRALVVGFGVIGSMIARLISWMPGVHVEVVDVHPAKLDLARRLGFRGRIQEQLTGGYDCVFHTSGTVAGLQTALDQIGSSGRVVEVSWYSSHVVAALPGESLPPQQKILISSQPSKEPVAPHVRQDCARRKRLALRLLENACWDEHLTRTIAFDDLPGFTPELAAGLLPGLAVLVDYHAMPGVVR